MVTAVFIYRWTSHQWFTERQMPVIGVSIFSIIAIRAAQMDFDQWFAYEMNHSGINDVRLACYPTCEMLTALISPWAGQAWNGPPQWVNACLGLSVHRAALSAAVWQQQLMNQRAEMHLKWFIWLVLDVFFFPVETTCAWPWGGGSAWVASQVCECVCWLTDVVSVKAWKYLPNKWIKVKPILSPHQQILYTGWIDSFLQWIDILGALLDVFLCLCRFIWNLVFEMNSECMLTKNEAMWQPQSLHKEVMPTTWDIAN